MTDANQWLAGWVIGSVASFIYFWGLWVTVQRLRDALNPVGLYATSLVLRLGILGIVMALVLNGDWRQVISAAIAFLVVRIAIVLAWGRTPVVRNELSERL